MSWRQITGHEKQRRRFQNALARGHLASTFLFVGPAGIGKYTFARELAKMLLCETVTKSILDKDDPNLEDTAQACDNCNACLQVTADSHPDLLVVRRLPNRNKLSIDQFVGEKEKRGREGLCHDIALKPFFGGRRIAIIDDADFFNQESANSLLKTLEEPPPRSVIILVGTSEQKQLSTIRSRSQIVRFDPLDQAQLETVIRQQQLLDPSQDIASIDKAVGGSIESAVQMVDSDALTFRQSWLEQLATLDPAQDGFSKTVGAFVDAAGKDAAVRRDRLRMVSEMAIHFYRALLIDLESHSGNELASSQFGSEVAAQVESILKAEMPSSRIADCLDRCFEAQQHIDANANQANIIESWLCDLGRIARGETIDAGI